MAQTKRKRRSTKHRGNAAGMIENRGRTGKSSAEGKDTKGRGGGKGKGSGKGTGRQDRWENPPTWRGAANRAVIATVIFVAVVLLVFKQPVQNTLPLGAFMLLIYIPLGFYTDTLLHRRRLKQREQPKR